MENTNANTIFENFLVKLGQISSMEEKEYVMIDAYDELAEAGYDKAECMYIWNQMMAYS